MHGDFIPYITRVHADVGFTLLNYTDNKKHLDLSNTTHIIIPFAGHEFKYSTKQ